MLSIPRFRRAFSALSVAAAPVLVGCESDGTSAPPPTEPARIVIATLPAELYEQDVLTLSASVLNSDGDVLSGTPVTWALDDAARGELAQNTLTLLSAGTLTVTARAGAVSGSRTLTVRRSPVLNVTVGIPAGVLLSRGDVAPVGVHVTGVGGRTLIGRPVQLSSSDNTVAVIDPSGRVRAIAAGTAIVRATAEGVTGTVRIDVVPDDAALTLSRLGDQSLPVRVDAFDVESGEARLQYEVWMEGGELTLSAGDTPRYTVQIRFATYTVATENGQRSLRLVGTSRELDHGRVTYDARGDLVLDSERVGALRHTANPLSSGMRVMYRVPSDDLTYDLFYRREPR